MKTPASLKALRLFRTWIGKSKLVTEVTRAIALPSNSTSHDEIGDGWMIEVNAYGRNYKVIVMVAA